METREERMVTTSCTTGLRVLELGSGLSGALAGMILSDNGAEVLKISHPEGDPWRGHPGALSWNRGKRHHLADLTTPHDAQTVRNLAAKADVLLASWEPGRAERFGLDFASLSPIAPQLVFCEITGFGSSGPYAEVPGYDGLVAARAGRMHEFSTLEGGTRPTYAAVPVASYGAAHLALQGSLAALIQRTTTGLGQRVQASLLQALTVYDMSHWYPGASRSLRFDDMPDHGYLPACTRDGHWVQFAQRSPKQLSAMLRNLGLEETISNDPRFTDTPRFTRSDDARALRDLILLRMREKTLEEWTRTFDADSDMSVVPFLGPGEVSQHPQFVHNGDVIRRSDSELGWIEELGPLADFSETPAQPGPPDTTSPTPIENAGWQSLPDTETPQKISDPASPNGRVLDGVTVLELSTWIATPTAATLFAELGAKVIKIEPLTGDPIRQYPGVHFKTTQGKQSLTVDLKSEEGRKILHQLVREADVLLHNYRPGVPERLGMDPATLHSINPGLVYVYGASFGSTGPFSSKTAYHPTFGALCGGVVKQMGAGRLPSDDTSMDLDCLRETSIALAASNESNPDFNAGIASTTSALMALFHRTRSQQGQTVETRMLCSNAYANWADFVRFPGSPPPAMTDSRRLGLGTLYRLYETAEGWIFLACPTPREFERLCRALSRPQWISDPRFEKPSNSLELATELEALFIEKSADTWEQELLSHGVGCVRADQGPVASFVLDSPFAREAGMVTDVEHPEIGRYPRYGPPVFLSRDCARMDTSHHAGAHNLRLLAELGYDADHIEKLENSGVIRSPEAPIATD
ncbi:CoA transferase [Myxococcota bacterium]|nr:CoA transferase [Myxococcota bacterium]